MNEKLPVALTIAGSDSGGGAGIQADLKTFSAHLVYGTSVITAITAQNTVAVNAVFELPPEIVGKQLEAVLSDISVDAVKIGMLSNADIIKTIAGILTEYSVKNIVLDPVMVAKSGDALLQESAISALIEYLIPISTIVTPNIPELGAILRLSKISEQQEDLIAYAREIMIMGAQNVLVKGGHLSSDELTDILVCENSIYQYTKERINTNNTHGTGCTLSSAIASNLAFGCSLYEAVKDATEWLYGAIQQHVRVGNGNNPVNHLYKLQKMT